MVPHACIARVDASLISNAIARNMFRDSATRVCSTQSMRNFKLREDLLFEYKRAHTISPPLSHVRALAYTYTCILYLYAHARESTCPCSINTHLHAYTHVHIHIFVMAVRDAVTAEFHLRAAKFIKELSDKAAQHKDKTEEFANKVSPDSDSDSASSLD